LDCLDEAFDTLNNNVFHTKGDSHFCSASGGTTAKRRRFLSSDLSSLGSLDDDLIFNLGCLDQVDKGTHTQKIHSKNDNEKEAGCRDGMSDTLNNNVFHAKRDSHFCSIG